MINKGRPAMVWVGMRAVNFSRPRDPGGPGLSLLLVLMVLTGACSKPPDVSERREGLQEIKTSARELSQTLEENLESQDGTINTEALIRHQQNMDAAADKVGGKMGEAIKAANQLNAEANAMAEEMNGLVELIPDLVNWQSLQEEEDYPRRREFIARYVALNQKMLDFYKEYPANLAAKLDGVDFHGRDRMEFEKGAVVAVQRIRPMIDEMRGADIALMGIFSKLIDIFEQEKGRWKVEDGVVVFEDEAHQKTYQDSLARIEVLADQQARAQKKTVESLKE